METQNPSYSLDNTYDRSDDPGSGGDGAAAPRTIYEEALDVGRDLLVRPMRGGGRDRVRVQHAKGWMTVFERIKDDYLAFAQRIDLNAKDIHFVPMSALKGDNVVNRSEQTPWYSGKPLMEILETVEIAADRNLDDLRFPVQYVNRPNLNFRGFAGTLASGVVTKGDAVVVLPSGKGSTAPWTLAPVGAVQRTAPVCGSSA